MKPGVAIATRAHARDLAPRLRPADAAEVMASHGLQPLPALLACLDYSDEAWAALHEGEVAYMWGLKDTSAGGVSSAAVWLLTSNLVERFPLAFIKHGRREIPRLLEDKQYVWNLIHAEHKQALGWAARVGFEVMAPVEAGELGHFFHPIVLRREAPACVSSSHP